MKNPSLYRCFFVSAGVLAVSPICSAAILSQWTFNSLTTAPSNYPASLTASNFDTTGTFSGTTGPISSATIAGVGGTAPYVFGAASLESSEAAAFSANEFYTVTLTPTGGNMLSFSTLSFNGWANEAFNAESYTFFLRTSLTGTTTLGSETRTYKVANTTAPSGSGSAISFDISGISALQNVTSATTFMIGIYINNRPASGFLGNMRMDSIQVDGTVSPIPEPSAAMLSLVGFGALLRRRQRSA